MKTESSIKTWAVEDRPREKLLKRGIQSLTDTELLAVIIGTGTKKKDVIQLSRDILNAAENNIGLLGRKTVADLKKGFSGIGNAKAVAIVAAMELGRRRKLEDAISRTKISSSRDVFEIFHPILADLSHEEFWILILNRSNKILDKVRISQGGISGTVIDPKLIFKPALDQLSSSLILIHNHPSGNLKPSDADIAITKKLKKGGDILDIPVLDHVIVTEKYYFSFQDEGILS